MTSGTMDAGDAGLAFAVLTDAASNASVCARPAAAALKAIVPHTTTALTTEASFKVSVLPIQFSGARSTTRGNRVAQPLVAVRIGCRRTPGAHNPLAMASSGNGKDTAMTRVDE